MLNSNQLTPEKILILERALRIFKYTHLNEPQPPFKLIMTPTDRCNLNCFFCPNYVARQKQRFRVEKELSDEEWLNVIKQGVKLNVRQWCFIGGGEPLLRREIILPALETIKKKFKKIDFEIITNGVLFTEEIIKRIVEICRESTNEEGRELARIQVTVSIHGKGKSYKEITGFDLYEKVLNNIKLFTKLRKEAPIIQINIVVNKKNIDTIEELVRELASINVDQIALHPIHVYEETRNLLKNSVPSFEEYKEVLDKIEKIKSKFPNTMIDALSLTSYVQQLNSSFRDERDKVLDEIKKCKKYRKYRFLTYRCFEPWYGMLINPDGRVGRCAAFVVRNEPINVREQSLKEIWFGNYLNKVRENVKNNLPMEHCFPCSLMSNTIILRNELKKFVDEFVEENKTDELENFIKKWWLEEWILKE